MIDGFSTIRKYSSPRILKSVTNLVTYRTESRDAIASKNNIFWYLTIKGEWELKAGERGF